MYENLSLLQKKAAPSKSLLRVQEKVDWVSVVPWLGACAKEFQFFFATIIAWKRTKDLAKAACHALYMS